MSVWAKSSNSKCWAETGLTAALSAAENVIVENPPGMTLEIRAATDLGMKRSQNEDSHGCWVSDDPAERERRGVLVVVADGMGGSRAGEVASRLAVQTVIQVYRDGQSGNPLDDLYHAVEAANHVVHTESVSHADMNGMGTTCTALVVRGADTYLAHVGDSRAYLVQGGRLRQLTQDHSLVAQLVRDGQLTAEQARTDPRRNVVTRSVGVSAHVEIDAQRFAALLGDGDTLLLCSDGLHGLVADPELSELALESRLEDGCKRAIVMANSRGGHDNITVVLARQWPNGQGSGIECAEVEIEPRLRKFERDDHDRGDVEHTQISMPAMPRPVAAVADDDDEDDEEEEVVAPRQSARSMRAHVAEDEAPDPGKTRMWIVIAVVVLLLAIAAAAFVLLKINDQSSVLGFNEAPAAGAAAWR